MLLLWSNNVNGLIQLLISSDTGPTLASWLPSVSVELPGNQNTSPGLGRNVVHEMYDSVSSPQCSNV